MDRFASMVAFSQVAESGGFTAAARHLGLSVASVSAQVQVLEESLGARLLNRTTRRVSLTEIGREYYERCAQILHELDEADQIAAALQAAPRGRLRVYCHQVLTGFTRPVATRFLADYPDVTLDLHAGDTMIDLVQERFDLAIMPFSPPDSTLITRTLGKSPRVLCCAPAYLETHGEPRTPADLANHNVLLYAYWSFGHEAHLTDPAGNSAAVRLSGNLVTTSVALLLDAALAGLGLVLLARYAVSDQLASGALVPVLSEYEKPGLEIVALYPHRRHLTAKVRLFLDRLAERFAEELRRPDAL